VLVCSGYAEDEVLLSGIDVGDFSADRQSHNHLPVLSGNTISVFTRPPYHRAVSAVSQVDLVFGQDEDHVQ
jgi:hypothetical protein